MRKAKNITYAIDMPPDGTDEYREMYGKLQIAGMSFDTAAKILKGQTNIRVGTLAQVMAAFELDSLDDLLNIEWE